MGKTGFDKIFARLQKTKGDALSKDTFEEMGRGFLLNAPALKGRFDAVWRWRELKWGRTVGIDLVARRADGGGYCAVMCRLMEESLTVRHISAFLAASESSFVERVLITTADRAVPHAMNLLKRQKQAPALLILRDGIIEARMDWSAWTGGRRAAPPSVPEPPLPLPSLRTVKKRLTEELILKWMDEHHQRTGAWPMHTSGTIPDSGGETWRIVESALSSGTRGMPGGSSVAKFLTVHRGVRNRLYPPKLTEEQILEWADAHHSRTGGWPGGGGGAITDAPGETWTAVDLALKRGSRGLPGGKTLAQFLAARRGVAYRLGRPKLTEERILKWADAHHRRTGSWPKAKTPGAVVGAAKGETWEIVSGALMAGSRGLPGGSSLARLLEAHRGVRNRANPPDLTEDQVLEWADAHHQRTGKWPTSQSGRVFGEDESWGLVDCALGCGRRGLPGGTTLVRLLAARRGVKNFALIPKVTEDKVLAWADAYRQRTGNWPTKASGIIEGTDGETWARVGFAMERGLLGGSPGKITLHRLFVARRGVILHNPKPPYSEENILMWADAYHRRTGKWPTCKRGGDIPEMPGETWAKVNNAFMLGLRGLPGGTSLAQFLVDRRSVRNALNPLVFTEKLILKWADDYHRANGAWPTKDTPGLIDGAEGATWQTVSCALASGRRGLPGGMTLGRLLKARRGVRIGARSPMLTEKDILAWADAHHQRTGHWPAVKSGPIHGVEGESWAAVDNALRVGIRGIAKKSSLAQLLETRRGVRNNHNVPKLTEEMILEWADAHHRKTGMWPQSLDGRVIGVPDETWVAVNLALQRGRRGLQTKLSLAQFLAARRGVRNLHALPPLTEEQILAWADAHYRRTGEWPKVRSGIIDGTNGETWSAVDVALTKGARGYPGGTSLSKLLIAHRGKSYREQRSAYRKSIHRRYIERKEEGGRMEELGVRN
jgi:hypothetical protein